MASEVGRSNRNLIDEITEDPSPFGFFQALRLLALSADQKNAQGIPNSLRFGTPLNMAFPASEIVSACSRRVTVAKSEPKADSDKGAEASKIVQAECDPMALVLTIGFMGLTGPSGVLPQAYTELLIDRRNIYGDTTAHGFLDVFSHRLISLFYATWHKSHFYIDYEAGEHDSFSRNVLDLAGMGSDSLQSRLKQAKCGISDLLFAHYAGLMAQRPMSVVNMASILRGHFNVGVAIEQFVGQWIVVPEKEQSHLGRRSCKLGEDAFVGARIWDRQAKFRITLGPLTSSQFTDFLPSHPGHVALLALVQIFVGHSLACDVTLKLMRQFVPIAVLSGHADSPLRLGYNIWLSHGHAEKHLGDTCYHLLK